MKHIESGRRWAWLVLAPLLVATALPAAAAPEFEPMTRAHKVNSLLALGDKVFGGTDDGGVLVWPAADPLSYERWIAGTQLSSARIVDLAWTGSHLWVATDDGGLTRVTDPAAAAPAFRQFGSTMPTFATTAVAGLVRDDVERVWYGLAGGGLGEIVSGFAGSVYTTDDGLVSNQVQTLHVHGDALWIGTPAGVTRFEFGVFYAASASLAGNDIRAFATDADGNLFAAGVGGANRWDPDAEVWVPLGSIGRPATGLATVGNDLYVLGGYEAGSASLHRYNGAGYDDLAVPVPITLTVAGADVLWLGGRIIADGMLGTRSSYAFLARLEGDDTATIWQPDVPLPASCAGVAFGADGSPWLGSRWGEAFSSRNTDGTWTNIYELADAANDSSGLINHFTPILALATGGDGVIWAPQLGAGVLRHDPLTGRTDQVRTFNSGLSGNSIVNVTVHPDGPVLLMHDWGDETDKVDVLIDPVAWRNPGNWISLPLGPGGLGDGPTVWDAHVARRDQIWFAVEGTGLVRWDINGLDAGAGDPLTWRDPTDDHWTPPIADFRDTFLDPTQARAITDGPGGTLWAGGNGVVRFRYEGGLATVLDDVGTFTGDKPGLSNGRVLDVVSDHNGYLWVATLSGLDRVRLGTGDPQVDSWFDAVTFATDAGVNGRYAPSSVADLPGVNYDFARLAVDADGRRVLASGDRGVALVDVGGLVGAAGGTEAVHLYPNPWQPGRGDGPLKIGGLAVESGETVEVGIYTLEGQLVYRDPSVAPDTGFWDGSNRVDSAVATGMYVVRVSWREGTVLRTLAVVR